MQIKEERRLKQDRLGPDSLSVVSTPQFHIINAVGYYCAHPFRLIQYANAFQNGFAMAVYSKSFSGFLGELEQTIESTAPRLLSLTEEQTRQTSAEDAWTRKQILGHLIDSATNNHQRFVRAQFTNDLVFPGYEQEQWVDAQHYNDEEWSQMVQLWKLYNLHLVHVASFISPGVLEQKRTEHNLDQIAWQTVDKQEAVTLEYFIRDYAEHLRHHLDQIFENV